VSPHFGWPLYLILRCADIKLIRTAHSLFVCCLFAQSRRLFAGASCVRFEQRLEIEVGAGPKSVFARGEVGLPAFCEKFRGLKNPNREEKSVGDLDIKILCV
jgi:hypothetical protein